MIEASQGLGLLIGPPFGSFLNFYGGYKCPFYSFGKLSFSFITLFLKVAIYIISYPFVVYNLYKSDSLLKDQLNNTEKKDDKEE